MTLRETGVAATVEEQVLRLAQLGVESGLRGLVASPRELAALRAAHGDGIKIVTPGIRPAGADAHDQKRALTPAEALAGGRRFSRHRAPDYGRAGPARRARAASRDRGRCCHEPVPVSKAGRLRRSRAEPDAAMNMAIDEALLEFSQEPTLRFYGWRRPSLSFGYFGKFADVAGRRRSARSRPALDRRRECAAWRRSDLFADHSRTAPRFCKGPRAIYAAVHAAIRDATPARRSARRNWRARPRQKFRTPVSPIPVRDDVLIAMGKDRRRRPTPDARAVFFIRAASKSPGCRRPFANASAAGSAAESSTREIPSSRPRPRGGARGRKIRHRRMVAALLATLYSALVKISANGAAAPTSVAGPLTRVFQPVQAELQQVDQRISGAGQRLRSGDRRLRRLCRWRRRQTPAPAPRPPQRRRHRSARLGASRSRCHRGIDPPRHPRA